MKTLIINGSPRKNGDTAKLINILKQQLKGEIVEIVAYNNIKPCLDCRGCTKKPGCAIKDDFEIICNNSYDNIVIASPIFTSTLPAPMISIFQRFNYMYNSKKYFNQSVTNKAKNALLILVGGGNDYPYISNNCVDISRDIFKKLGTSLKNENIVLSKNTDTIPAIKDMLAISKIVEIAEKFNTDLKLI